MRNNYTKDVLEIAVSQCTSLSGVLRYLGVKQAGGTQAHIKKRIKQFGISTDHFTGQSWAKGTSTSARKTPDDILVLRSGGNRQKATLLRRALIESGIPYECLKCGQQPFWLGEKLILDVDHINENWLDDRIENLRFLCPNCHSQFSRKLLGS